MFQVKEVADLFSDACIRHPDTGELLLLSVFGRDTSMLQFFSSFALPSNQGGLTSFTLLNEDGQPSTVQVSKPERLQKLSGKLPKANLFGSLSHTWIYDPVITKPDRANRKAWGIYVTHGLTGEELAPQEIEDQLWQLVKDLSPVPLADEWRAKVLCLGGQQLVTWLDEKERNLHPPLGRLRACQVHLADTFVENISAAVKAGDLVLEGIEPPQAGAVWLQGRTVVQPGSRPQAEPAWRAGKLPIALGSVCMTATVESLGLPREAVLGWIKRHQSGDWGCVSKDGVAQNEEALRTGEARFFSAYPIDPSKPSEGFGTNTVWVITEWDHSVTTVLLPEDY